MGCHLLGNEFLFLLLEVLADLIWKLRRRQDLRLCVVERFMYDSNLGHGLVGLGGKFDRFVVHFGGVCVFQTGLPQEYQTVVGTVVRGGLTFRWVVSCGGCRPSVGG